MRAWNGEAAESGVLAEVLLVGGVIIAGIGLYAVFWWSEPPTAPPAIALDAEPATSTQTRAFTVTTVATPLSWGDVEMRLDGEILSYERWIVSDETYCVAIEGTTCASDVPQEPIAAGHTLRVHAIEVAGKTLTLADREANRILLSVTLSS